MLRRGGAHRPQCTGWFSGCSISESGVLGSGCCCFVGFWPRFRLSVVSQAQCCGRMGFGAVPCGFLFGLLGIFQAVEGGRMGLCLALGFIAMEAQTEVISLCLRTEGCCFLTIRRVYHQFVFQNLMLLAVAIKLYCFKLSLMLEW